jgi:hypothetical protein
MIGRLVPWEIAWFLAHGQPAKALRRLRPNSPDFKSGPVPVQAYSVREIVSAFATGFRPFEFSPMACSWNLRAVSE